MDEIKNEETQETKKCSKCKRLRPTSCFAKSSRRVCGLQDYCRSCVRERDQAKYHFEDGKARTKFWNKQRRQRHLDRVSAYLCAHKCTDCKESDPVVLEFDHRDPTTKIDDISAMVGYCSWKKIEDEIAKCDVVCASCHKRRTAIKFGWRRAKLIHTVGRVLSKDSLSKEELDKSKEENKTINKSGS